jgi:hypothetical protein
MNSYNEVLEEQDHIRNLIREYTRHLRHLEIQKAQMGMRSDASLLVSIDDTRNEISNLRKKDDLLDELLNKYIIFESCQNQLKKIIPKTNEILDKLPEDEYGSAITNYDVLLSIGLYDLADELKNIDSAANLLMEESNKAEIEIKSIKQSYADM